MKRFLVITTTAIMMLAFQNCAPVHEQLGALDESSMDPNLVASVDAFETTLYPFLDQNCAGCHGDSHTFMGIPGFAVSDVLSAHTNLRAAGLVDLDVPASSEMVSKIAGGHSGFNGTHSAVIEGLINDWVSAL